MAKVHDLISEKRLNKLVATDPEVQAALKEEATKRATQAESDLASHTKTGEHHIEVTHGSVDYTVSLVGPAAAALELGHMDHGRWVEGIHILRR